MASTEALRRQFYAAIVTTAVEGGIGYWSQVEEYHWFDPELAGGTAEPGPDGTANAWAVIVPNLEEPESTAAKWPEDGGVQRARVDLDAVIRAVGRITRGELPHNLREEYVRPLRQGRPSEWDASEIDSDVADVVVQVAVFGEVVFG